jgi:curved DNA-binding protein CbpA
MVRQRAWYEVLGVSPAATDEEIREAYIGLVKRWHPDRHQGDAERERVAHAHLSEINAAYDLVRARGAARAEPSRTESHDGAYAGVDPWPRYVWEEPAGGAAQSGPFFRPGSLAARAVALLLAVLFGFGAIVRWLPSGRPDGTRALGAHQDREAGTAPARVRLKRSVRDLAFPPERRARANRDGTPAGSGSASPGGAEPGRRGGSHVPAEVLH